MFSIHLPLSRSLSRTRFATIPPRFVRVDRNRIIRFAADRFHTTRAKWFCSIKNKPSSPAHTHIRPTAVRNTTFPNAKHDFPDTKQIPRLEPSDSFGTSHKTPQRMDDSAFSYEQSHCRATHSKRPQMSGKRLNRALGLISNNTPTATRRPQKLNAWIRTEACTSPSAVICLRNPAFHWADDTPPPEHGHSVKPRRIRHHSHSVQLGRGNPSLRISYPTRDTFPCAIDRLGTTGRGDPA